MFVNTRLETCIMYMSRRGSIAKRKITIKLTINKNGVKRVQGSRNCKLVKVQVEEGTNFRVLI